MKKNADTLNTPLVRAIRHAYKRGQEDESLEPLVLVDSSGDPIGRFRPRDSVIFYDLRGEREVELTQSLTDPGFPHFPIQKDLALNFVTMIEYSPFLDVRVAFPPEGDVKNTLAEVVTSSGMKLLKIAESEKAVHIGYFMNGKREEAFPGEERILIPSPEGIMDYARVPEMKAQEIATEVCRRTADPFLSLIIANLANVDVIGHLEDQEAILKAVLAVDEALGRIVEACRKERLTLIVTADHGTVEEWRYPDGAVNTGHTKNPVPFIIADFSENPPGPIELRPEGELADVAPTVLHLLGLASPPEMTGRSLLRNLPQSRGDGRRVLLLILDGWGIRRETYGNLIHKARTRNFDTLWKRFPHALLDASGEAVGMPAGTVGNSEAGHLHIGAGRHILLDRVRIDRATQDGSFERNPAFLWAMETARKSGTSLHLLGIVSHYSSHGTIRHLRALLQLARKRGVKNVYIHALIGRRGERPESGAIYVAKVHEMCRAFSTGEVVTVIGRFWALDREFNWDRVEKTYRALVYGEGTPVALESGLKR